MLKDNIKTLKLSFTLFTISYLLFPISFYVDDESLKILIEHSAKLLYIFTALSYFYLEKIRYNLTKAYGRLYFILFLPFIYYFYHKDDDKSYAILAKILSVVFVISVVSIAYALR